jgi:glucokinase
VVRAASNLPFRDFPLGPRLADALGVPVTIVVDTAAAAIAEFAAGGAAAGQRTGAYVTVSTGIGMALVVDGRLHAGARSQAGELGHVPVAVGDGALNCPCGQRGCLEAYASGSGLVRRAAAGHSAADILRLARAGTPWASDLVADAVDRLAAALAGVIRVLDPDVMVLGGGLLVHTGLFDPVRERIADLLRATVPNAATIVRPAAYGDLSPLRGAAALARRDPDALALSHSDGPR